MNQAVLPIKPVLKVRGLGKRFAGIKVLDAIDLDIAKGEVVCLMGPSGAGKSTLLRSINWLEPPDAGSVSVLDIKACADADGAPSKRDIAGIRRLTAMVFQSFALWPHLTVLQNVMLAPVHVHGRTRSEARAEAETLLERVGLGDKRNALPSRLSGGQKQRVGIARALATRAPLLLFDEPTSALDPELVGEVLSVIQELAGEHRTMLLVTHEVAFARDIADRVVFLDHGLVAEDVSAERFFSEDTSSRSRQFLARHLGGTKI
jgi:polar amino acid transport system ATP-binding protein